ncbi:MAG: preprotein translocase subunit SecE [Pseudomonadales bacterium]|nr:preprotein translocase subunit SecE [Pseudomonadales bacterium]
MSTGSEAAAQSPLDWLKWLVVVVLVSAGVFGNWYFQDQALLYRVLALLALAGLAAFVAGQTDRGRAAWHLMKDARNEIRRVVWPKRPETVQTTGIVLVLVVVFGLILWLLDSGLSWIVSSVIG